MSLSSTRDFPVAALVGLLVVLSVSALGCAKRLALTSDELARVDRLGVKRLRVYPSKKLIVMYEKTARDGSYEVTRRIEESERRDEVKHVIPKSTAGQVIDRGERNGAQLLWVTFDPACDDKSCAFGWVQTESGRFRLSILPAREGARDPVPYRGCKRKRKKLAPGKMASLAEMNDVYLLRKRNGKVRTVELEVFKITDKGVNTKVQRSRGID
ncbi:MAG: hypothetical protein V3V08_07480 [Nannocystaceae bacterium]